MVTRGNPLAQATPKSVTSSMAVGGHPVHPMLVNFPIAFLSAALPADLAFWWTGDPFWARMAVWLLGAGFGMGLLAAAFGTLDFLVVREVRRYTSSWTHFLLGVTLLGIAGTNWWWRVADAQAAVLPWGLFLSAITLLAVAAAGWMGGKLVFDHNIGRED